MTEPVELNSEERRRLFEQYPPGTLVDVYVKLREAREKVREYEKQWTAKMEDAEAVLMTKMDELKQTNFKGTSGFTAYLSTLETVGVLDSGDFRAFIEEDENGLDYLDLRPNKEMTMIYAEAHEGALPPGVKLNSKRRVNVRKS